MYSDGEGLDRKSRRILVTSGQDSKVFILK